MCISWRLLSGDELEILKRLVFRLGTDDLRKALRFGLWLLDEVLKRPPSWFTDAIAKALAKIGEIEYDPKPSLD